jgi:hypothetical protein
VSTENINKDNVCINKDKTEISRYREIAKKKKTLEKYF